MRPHGVAETRDELVHGGGRRQCNLSLTIVYYSEYTIQFAIKRRTSNETARWNATRYDK